MTLSGLKWRSTERGNPDVVAEAYYDDMTREYLVIVRRGTEQRERRFLALYDPTFGVDYADVQKIRRLATQLADELTGEKGEET